MHSFDFLKRYPFLLNTAFSQGTGFPGLWPYLAPGQAFLCCRQTFAEVLVLASDNSNRFFIDFKTF